SWLWPSPRLLRPMLATALSAMGVAGLIMAGLFAAGLRSWLIPAVIAHAGLVGIANGVRQMCLWELIGRGLSPTRRAWTLGWTFGLGPVLAVLASCVTQLVLSGKFLDLVRLGPVPQPWSFVLLYGVTGPVMFLSAALVSLADVPHGPEPGPVGIGDILEGLR